MLWLSLISTVVGMARSKPSDSFVSLSIWLDLQLKQPLAESYLRRLDSQWFVQRRSPANVKRRFISLDLKSHWFGQRRILANVKRRFVSLDLSPVGLVNTIKSTECKRRLIQYAKYRKKFARMLEVF